MRLTKRPWGSFIKFVSNKKCTVKLLQIKAGQELSLQIHKKRDETWYFLDAAKVQLGEKKFKVKKGSLIKVPRKTPHRIISLKKDARVLEISFGKFEEKDEIRLEDKYGRK